MSSYHKQYTDYFTIDRVTEEILTGSVDEILQQELGRIDVNDLKNENTNLSLVEYDLTDLTTITPEETSTSFEWDVDGHSQIAADGSITVPPNDETIDGTITLIARRQNEFDTKVFDITTINPVLLDQSALEIGLGNNPDLDNVTTDLTFSSEGTYGSTITWDASAHSQITNAGVVTPATLTISQSSFGTNDDSFLSQEDMLNLLYDTNNDKTYIVIASSTHLSLLEYNPSTNEWGYASNGENFATIASGRFHAVIVKNTGNIYAAFRDSSNGNKLTVYKWNQTSWSTVGSAGFSNGQLLYVSLSISDDESDIYVFYREYIANQNYPAYMKKFNGVSWVSDGSPSFSNYTADSCWLTSIIDNNDRAIVFYLDSNNNDYLTASWWNGSSWVQVGDTVITENRISAAYPLSATLDSNTNTIYVGYRVPNDPIVSKLSNGTGSWTTLPTPNNPNNYAGSGIIYFLDDRLWLVYHDTSATDYGEPFVEMYNGSTWTLYDSLTLPGYARSKSFTSDSNNDLILALAGSSILSNELFTTKIEISDSITADVIATISKSNVTSDVTKTFEVTVTS